MFTNLEIAKSVSEPMKRFLKIKVPVYRDAIVGLSDMQVIVFSHGFTAHRMIYSALYMELASCGYCVVALTHNDGSADYSPQASYFKNSKKMHDYEFKNEQVKIRE